MKKIVPVVIILILLAFGGYFYMKSKKAVPGQEKALVKTDSVAPGNIFTSIKDALAKSLTLQCNFKDEQGVQTTTYIKGGAVRVAMAESADKKQPNNVLIKDKKMYMWNDTDKTGFSYTMAEPAVTGAAVSPAANNQPASSNKEDSVLATIEKYKDACKTAVIADSFFQVPADVKFQDMSDFTNQLMKQVPTQGAGGNAADYQNYINQMIKNQGGSQ